MSNLVIEIKDIVGETKKYLIHNEPENPFNYSNIQSIIGKIISEIGDGKTFSVLSVQQENKILKTKIEKLTSQIEKMELIVSDLKDNKE